VHAARGRRLPLLLATELLDADSLALVAAAALEDNLPVAPLRPSYRASGLRSVVAAGRNESIEALAIDLGGLNPRALLHAALAATLRLLPGRPTALVASAWGSPEARGGATVTLRYADGRLATLDVRRSETPSLRVQAETLVSPLALRRLSASGDALLREAAAAARTVATGPAEVALLASEAAVLHALDAALETGDIVEVEVARPRAALHLIATAADPRASTHVETLPRRTQAHGLRLIVS
ncbi:MAG: hypothetical protein O2798_01030, partial [Chloroflexi bacterium]|nr:hypothetical protein [Chloroflexota bacterium]